MADRDVRKKLEDDPGRDMSHVPGNYNPGNQAGKDVRSDGQDPESPLGKKEGNRTPEVKPRQTGAPGEKDK
jgi:hypothetical protein